MSQSEKSSSLVVFVNLEEPSLKLTFTQVSLKVLADSVGLSLLLQLVLYGITVVLFLVLVATHGLMKV